MNIKITIIFMIIFYLIIIIPLYIQDYIEGNKFVVYMLRGDNIYYHAGGDNWTDNIKRAVLYSSKPKDLKDNHCGKIKDIKKLYNNYGKRKKN